MRYLLLILLPSVLLAQTGYGPLRLDENTPPESEFFEAIIEVNESGDLYAQWSFTDQTICATQGRRILANGTYDGEIILHDNTVIEDSWACAPYVRHYTFTSGAGAKLLYHS